MDSLSSNASAPSSPIPTVPGWAVSRRASEEDADAAFAAGSALQNLDNLVRREPVWAGCWRDRLALSCASSAVRLMGRNEDETALRDALLLRAEGGEPGPAGDVWLAFRRLSGRTGTLDGKAMDELASLLALRRDEVFETLPGLVDEAVQSGRAAPFAAAGLFRKISALRPDAEILAWWMADWLIAKKLGWTQPVPLLMAGRHGTAFRTSGGRGRLRPEDEGFERAFLLALVHGVGDALRLATEIDRRAGQLLSAAPKVRTKGADGVIRSLLNTDAVSASAPGSGLSRWASRRLFERLESFGAVREFSGRPAFRLYGL